MYLVMNKWVIAVKVSNFSGQYFRNHWTLDIGVLGYIGIVWPKEHSPEVWSVPPVSPCLNVNSYLTENKCRFRCKAQIISNVYRNNWHAFQSHLKDINSIWPNARFLSCSRWYIYWPYSDIYPKRCNLTQFIYLWKLLYMFRVVSPPIIRTTHVCIYSIWYLSNRYCYLPLLCRSWNFSRNKTV